VVAHVPLISQYLGVVKLTAGAGGAGKEIGDAVPPYETLEFGHRQTTISRPGQSMTQPSTGGIAVLHR